MIDLIIVVSYFVVVFFVALRGRVSSKETTADDYFLSNRGLRWPSIALSTIATNVQGYQFLGMMGSAYLFGLAQASLEINAIQGILLAAFVFVPFYLKNKVITISQFIREKAGSTISRIYSLANIVLFSTITLGAALFWGAYAAEIVFSDYLMFLGQERTTRIAILLIGLGIFSAVYTYLGGLTAVVKTDIIQFLILISGGLIVVFTVVNEAGGWSSLYEKTPDKMHLYLPADHPVLPWTHMLGLFFLNINYWCANQSIIQRSLAAKNLAEAQKGLLVGGLLKYVMAVVIVVPGIALYGMLGEGNGLSDPDEVFPYLVNTYLGVGLKGVVLCALFASLMSTVDSTFNSISTLWSVDIYKGWIRPDADDHMMVKTGKNAILVTLSTGIVMGLVLLFLKFENPGAAFTHTLNELRYYINCGIVVIIVSVAFLISPNRQVLLLAFFLTIVLHLTFIQLIPDLNYFLRAFYVILISLTIVFLASYRRGFVNMMELFESFDRNMVLQGIALFLSLVAVHIIFR